MLHPSRRFKQGLLTCLLLTVLTGCADVPDINFNPGQNSTSTYDRIGTSPYSNEQEISYSASTTLQTKDYEKDRQALLDTLAQYEGSVQSENSQQIHQDKSSNTYIQTYYSLQIPSDKLHSFTTDIQKKFTVSQFNLNSRDVSEEKDSRQKNIEQVTKEISELQTQLEQEGLEASDKKDIQDQIRQLEKERQSLEDAQDSTDKSVNYADISLTLSEVPYYYNEKPSVAYYFQQAFSNFLAYAIYVLAFALMAVIFVLPFILLAALTYLTVRKQWYKWLHKMYKTGKFTLPVSKPTLPTIETTDTSTKDEITPVEK